MAEEGRANSTLVLGHVSRSDASEVFPSQADFRLSLPLPPHLTSTLAASQSLERVFAARAMI